MAAAFYFGNDDPGRRLFLFGRNGAEAILYNPDSEEYVSVPIPVNGDATNGVNVSLFDDLAYVDGVPESSLQDQTAYYSYAFLPVGGGSPTFNFTNIGFANPALRYKINVSQHPKGMPEWTDPAGNRCLLVGMCYPVDDGSSVGLNVASKFNNYPPRILASPSPWNESAPQPLPATSGMAGGSISGSTMHEINPQYHRIVACAWAWRGIWSLLQGKAVADTANSKLTAQVRVKSLSVPGSGYTTAATHEVTAVNAGDSVPIFGHNALALDDGVYEFSFWAAASSGSFSYNVTHTLHGWV